MTNLVLFDVKCGCGFQSSAKKDRGEIDRLAQKHMMKPHAPDEVAGIRELHATLDEKGRVVPPVVVVP